jgi:DNA ligase (NAD+)
MIEIRSDNKGVAGAEVGSKLAEAHKHGVTVLSKAEWLKLIGG